MEHYKKTNLMEANNLENNKWVEHFWNQTDAEKIRRIVRMGQDEIEELKSCSDKRELELFLRRIKQDEQTCKFLGTLSVAGAIATTDGVLKFIMQKFLSPQEMRTFYAISEATGLPQMMRISNLCFSAGAGASLTCTGINWLVNKRLQNQDKEITQENENKPVMEDMNEYLLFNHDCYC